MPRNYSLTDVANWKFNEVDMPQEWVDHLGNVTENFRMLVQGAPKNGKTEYLLQLGKMLAQCYGKVKLTNVEQGKSASLKQAIIRNEMDAIKGKFMLDGPQNREFESWFKDLCRKGSGRVIMLDSLDYMKLTIDQFKRLHERFKNKSFIIVCWDEPFDPHAKKIKYMCDIVVDVSEYRAKIRSRFGGNKTHIIWKEGYDRIVQEKLELRKKEREEREQYLAEKARKKEQGSTPLFEGDGNTHGQN